MCLFMDQKGGGNYPARKGQQKEGGGRGALAPAQSRGVWGVGRGEISLPSHMVSRFGIPKFSCDPPLTHPPPLHTLERVDNLLFSRLLYVGIRAFAFHLAMKWAAPAPFKPTHHFLCPYLFMKRIVFFFRLSCGSNCRTHKN